MTELELYQIQYSAIVNLSYQLCPIERYPEMEFSGGSGGFKKLPPVWNSGYENSRRRENDDSRNDITGLHIRVVQPFM